MNRWWHIITGALWYSPESINLICDISSEIIVNPFCVIVLYLSREFLHIDKTVYFYWDALGSFVLSIHVPVANRSVGCLVSVLSLPSLACYIMICALSHLAAAGKPIMDLVGWTPTAMVTQVNPPCWLAVPPSVDWSTVLVCGIRTVSGVWDFASNSLVSQWFSPSGEQHEQRKLAHTL